MADEEDNDKTVSMQVPSELIVAETGVPVQEKSVLEELDDEETVPNEDDPGEPLPDLLLQPDGVDPLGSTMQTGAVTREMLDDANASLDTLDEPPTVTRPEAIAVGPPTREDPAEPDSVHGANTRKTVPTAVPPMDTARNRTPLIVAVVLAIGGSLAAWQLYPTAGQSASSALMRVPGDVDVVGALRVDALKTSWAGAALQRRIDQFIADNEVSHQRELPIQTLLPGLKEIAFGASGTHPEQSIVVMTGDLDRAAFIAKMNPASEGSPGPRTVDIAGNTFYGGPTMLTGFSAEGDLLSGHKTLIKKALSKSTAEQQQNDHPAVSAAIATIDTGGHLWLAAKLTSPLEGLFTSLAPKELGSFLRPGDRIAFSITLDDPTVIRAGAIFADPIRAKKAKTSLDTVIALARTTHAAAAALGKPVEDETGGVLDRIDTALENESILVNVTIPVDVARHLLDRGLQGNIGWAPSPPGRMAPPSPPGRMAPPSPPGRMVPPTAPPSSLPPSQGSGGTAPSGTVP